MLSPILERLCLSLKADTSLIQAIGMVKDMSKFSPQRGIKRCCQGKLFSTIVSQGVSFSRKTWCCAIGANLDTFFGENFPYSYTHPKKFWHVFDWAGWHSSSGELNFSQPGPSAVIHPDGGSQLDTPTLTEETDKKLPLRKSLVWILAQSQTQIHTLTLIPCRNLLLSPIFLQRNLLSCLR